MRITLLGMGVPAAEKDRLRCILRVENLSEESLPFQINGMNVNRTSFKCYGSRYQLAPGGACYASTYLNRSELERSGIDSISDVELWLMTDQRENNGLMLDPDGTWFPVELNERGETVSDPEYETLLYEDELVRIALVGTEQYDWTETSSYTWHLLVWNLSDQDLTLTSEANSAGLDVRFYTVVGVQSCVYDDASYEIPQGEPLPSIPFSFAIYSTGRASLLKTVPDAFQLPGF